MRPERLIDRLASTGILVVPELVQHLLHLLDALHVLGALIADKLRFDLVGLRIVGQLVFPDEVEDRLRQFPLVVAELCALRSRVSNRAPNTVHQVHGRVGDDVLVDRPGVVVVEPVTDHRLARQPAASQRSRGRQLVVAQRGQKRAGDGLRADRRRALRVQLSDLAGELALAHLAVLHQLRRPRHQRPCPLAAVEAGSGTPDPVAPVHLQVLIRPACRRPQMIGAGSRSKIARCDTLTRERRLAEQDQVTRNVCDIVERPQPGGFLLVCWKVAACCDPEPGRVRAQLVSGFRQRLLIGAIPVQTGHVGGERGPRSRVGFQLRHGAADDAKHEATRFCKPVQADVQRIVARAFEEHRH